MNNSLKHIQPIVLHFRSWSNKSYAIFNSIGRVVRIGFLSKIIQRLVTVKSLVFSGSLNLFHELDENDDGEDELTHTIEISNIRLVDFLSIPITTSVSNRIESSYGEFKSVVTHKNDIKACLGPFLFLWNPSIMNGFSRPFSDNFTM